MASDDGESGVLEHAAELALAVDVQLVLAGRPVAAARLEKLCLTHHAARTIERARKSEHCTGGKRPILAFRQASADLPAVQDLDHEPPRGGENPPELTQSRSIGRGAQVAERRAQAEHGIEAVRFEREREV